MDGQTAAKGIQPLTDYELASRLSYFLWSSMPDKELLDHAKAGDLHQPAVLAAETKRMLQDGRIQGLATKVLAATGSTSAASRSTTPWTATIFPSFTNDLRDGCDVPGADSFFCGCRATEQFRARFYLR